MHPQQLVDKLHNIHKKVYERLNIDYTNYSRTSNLSHHKTVQDFFNVINENGYVSKGSMRMYFCENDNMFLPDRFVVGICPKCDYEYANADQCESCTSVLSSYESPFSKNFLTHFYTYIWFLSKIKNAIIKSQLVLIVD